MTGPDVLDPATLARLQRVAQASENADLMPRLISLFLEDSTERLVGLRVAVERQDIVAIRALAHAIRGGAATLGANEVVGACTALEDLEAEATLEAQRRSLEALSQALERATVALCAVRDR